jgi:hypothetical protein
MMTGSIQHKEITMENTLHSARRDPNFWCCIKSILKIKIPQRELDALWIADESEVQDRAQNQKLKNESLDTRALLAF